MLKRRPLGQESRSLTGRPALKPIPICTWPLALPKRAIPQVLQSRRQLHLCRVAQGAATPSGPVSAPPAPDSNTNWKKGFWTFVDVVAILGSVGGALAAILNLFSGTYVLFLPLVLPVVSLLSALQREGLIAEDNRRAYDTLRASLTRDSTALLADARGALEEVRRELRGQNTTAARLGTIEARLSSLEGSILSAGRSAREAAAGLGVLPERLQAEQRAMLEGLVAAMRLELRRAAESLANNETTALARLDARLAAVEGSLSGLEVAQSEGLRRLSMSLNSALADAEATLQSSVRNEVARSMEPVRRLPQMLAVALPPALAAAEAVEASAAAGPASAGPGAAGAPAAAAVLTPEQLQAVVSQEVEGAVARILDFQVDALGRLTAVRPVPMDEEQWSALGRRLTRLERLVEGVPAGTEGALLQGGQVPAAVAAAVATAVGEALAAQLADARVEVAAAAAREAEGVRNDLLASRTVLRESLDGLAAALQPLQLGVTELQLAVAAVSKAQADQQLELQAVLQPPPAGAAATAGEPDGVSGGTADASAAAAAPPPAELTRLLEGLEAVAQLLRDVDSKMDRVTAAVGELPAAAAGAAAAAAAAAAIAAPAAAPAPAPAPPPLEATAEAAAAAKQQQLELQASVDAMREALAALATQVGLMASKALPAVTSKAGLGGGGVIADVLSFEASLTSAAAAPPERSSSSSSSAAAAAVGTSAVAESSGSGADIGDGDTGEGRSPSTAGATRDEAYDMMLQLAEARRRSGSEASSSTVASDRSISGSRSAGGGAAASSPGAAPPRAVDPQLRIEGLPPFQGPSAGGAVDPTVSATAAELPPLPPLEREIEEQDRQLQLQQQELVLEQQQRQQQQQQAAPPAAWQQAELQSAVDSQVASTSAAQVAAMPAATAAAETSEMAPSPYGIQTEPLPYDLTGPSPAFSGMSAPPFPSTPSPPGPSTSPYGMDGGFAAAEGGYAQPQDQGYSWDRGQSPPPPSSQQPQPPQIQPRTPYSPYEQPRQGVSGGGYSANGFQESNGYGATGATSPAAAPYPESEAQPPWYGAQQPLPPPSQQQQQQQEQQPFAQPPPRPSLTPQLPQFPQMPQLPQMPKLPFWAGFGGAVAAAASAPPAPPPLSRSSPQPPVGGSEPRATSAPYSPPGFGPLPTPPPLTPPPSLQQQQPQQPPLPSSPQQQQQQQPRPSWAGTPGPGASVAAPASAAPTPSLTPAAAVPAVDYRPKPLDGMSVNEMISEGLRLLRLGREETRKGEDYGLADTLIQGAIAAFTRAAEQPNADAKAQGNLGNALLARGELKAAYLEALRSGPPPASSQEAATQRDAERAMTMEANALLTEAGVMFLKVLELEGWSSRALVNWGRALVIRADLLAATPDGLAPGSPTLPVVAQLYTSAIDKFEGVLEGEPDMVPAKYRCALAMAGMSRTKAPGSRERLTLLADAINYLRDVISSQSPDAEALRRAAMAALQQYEAQLMAQRAARQ